MPGLERQRHRSALWLHPYREVLESVVGFLGAVATSIRSVVGDVATNIFPERVAKLIVIFCEQRLDGFELRLAPRDRRVALDKKNSLCCATRVA